jgi:aminotransferase MxcL
VRFFQNGGDACAAAVRLARAVTGGQTIGTQGYHGAALDFAHMPQVAGQEFAMTRHNQFEFCRVERMWQVAKYAACLMVEVPSVDEQIAVDFLRECRKAADYHEIPLIIDDVVGGFRFALAGTCERYGVKADLICLGKAMSALGGVSALVGDMDIVQHLGDDVFYSTTFGGNPGPLRVALESIEWLRLHQSEVYGPDGHLQSIGTLLKDGLNGIGVPCVGQPERSALAFKDDATWLEFCQRMISKGVMMHRPNFVTLAHTPDDVALTIGTAGQVVKEMGL